MIVSERVILVPFNQEHYSAIFNGDNKRLGELLIVSTPRCWSEFAAANEAINSLYSIFKSLGGDVRWGSYFIVCKTENTLIGTCCFKGTPDSNNSVEIGYEINEAYQNKGFATEVSTALIRYAFSQNVSAIKAHTLAHENASVSVLKKCNFIFASEINDPEDGLVWEWILVKGKNGIN